MSSAIKHMTTNIITALIILSLFSIFDYYLYFDVLSGRVSDDFEEDKYYFYFATPKKADEWNKKAEAVNSTDDANDDDIEYFAKVSDLFKMDVSTKQKYRKQITKKLSLTEDDELRLEANLSKIDEVLTKEQNILKASIIDENKPTDSLARQTESDVL